MVDPIVALQKKLGHRFADQKLLLQALTHRSYSHEHPGQQHNERLEFLGDAILQFTVSDALFRACADADEGDLSRRRASLVSTIALGRQAQALSLGEHLRLGNGEANSGGRDKVHLLANTFEAVIGACFVDSDIAQVTALVQNLLGPEIQRVASEIAPVDFKTELQERQQRQGLAIPDYQVVDHLGPEHARQFVVEVRLDDGKRARGQASSKKKAERAAARQMLETLDQRPSSSNTSNTSNTSSTSSTSSSEP